MRSIGFILIFLLSSEILFSKALECAVPVEIASEAKGLLKKTIPYTQLKVKIKKVSTQLGALKALTSNPKVKFAMIRRDVLWQIQNEKYPQPKLQNYITISTLPYLTQLFLIQTNDKFDAFKQF